MTVPLLLRNVCLPKCSSDSVWQDPAGREERALPMFRKQVNLRETEIFCQARSMY